VIDDSLTSTTESVNDRPIVQVTDAGIFYRASALGGCFRALWAARQGFEPKSPPANMQAIFDEGHRIEEMVLDRLEAEGWNIYNRQKEIQVPVNLPSELPIFITGHLDALGCPPEGLNARDPEAHLFEHIIEIKGFGSSNMEQYKRSGLKAFPRYRHQIAAYSVGVPCGDVAFVVYEKETDKIRVDFFQPDVPEWELTTIILAVEEMVSKQQIPKCDALDYPCPYYYLHDPKEMPMPLALDADMLVTAILTIDEQRKILNDARSVLMGQLEEKIGWVEGAPMSYDSTRAIVVVTANPRSLDRQKILDLLTEAELDPADYEKPSHGHHLRFNIKKS
jgi:hypothetical protein